MDHWVGTYVTSELALHQAPNAGTTEYRICAVRYSRGNSPSGGVKGVNGHEGSTPDPNGTRGAAATLAKPQPASVSFPGGDVDVDPATASSPMRSCYFSQI